MSTYVLKLPDVGEGIAEAEIVEWHVNVGDEIQEDDVLVDVMTDKATVELPSPVTGTVTWLGGAVGDIVRIGAELIRLDVDGQAGAEVAAAPTVRPLEQQAQDKEHDRQQPDGVPADAPPTAPPPAATAPARAPVPTAAARAPTAARSPAAAAVSTNHHPQAGSNGHKPLAAPAVRRRARALDIDLGSVPGTGPEGRIEHEDLDALLDARAAPPPRGAPEPPAVSLPAPAAGVEDDVNDVKVVGLRRNIAQRMQLSKRKIPHFTYVEEIDVSELEEVRAALNQHRGEHRPSLTLLPFLVRAIVVAVHDFPQMNARFNDDDGIIQRHRSAHVGIAVQTPKGLMVPVLKNAQARDLWDSAAEIARLSAAARDATVTLAELTGSTITITSLGALGGIVSTPVINYPEVAVVGVNKIVVRPVYRDGAFVPRQLMNLSSSFDHRVIDGWDAAQFIQRIKTLLETPPLLLTAT